MLERPLIDTTEAELHELADEAWKAILAANDPPQIFRRGSELVYVGEGEGYRAALVPHTKDSLSDLMSRTAKWRKRNAKGAYTVVFPSDRVAKIVLGWDPAKWGDVPRIDRVTRTPFFAAPEGQSVWASDEYGEPTHEVELVTTAGYHAPTRTWYDPDPELAGLEVSGSDSDLREAKKIVDKVLADFPWSGKASRAHAISLMLLPFVRELIDGDTPLYLITAPTPGTGKGLLTDVCLMPAVKHISRSVAAKDDEEMRKRITSELLKAQPVILFDNILSPPGLESGAMAAVLTAGGWWTDRVLGQSRVVTLPVRNVWVASGNNVAVSNENSRRVARIHLDRGVEDPAAVKNFRIPNLTEWIRENRQELVWAALTIIQSWLNGHTVEDDHYLPALQRGSEIKQSYIEWSRVMGGLLRHIGEEGFLDQEELLDTTERDELAEFFALIAAETESQWFTADDLVDRIVSLQSQLDRVMPTKLAGLDAKPDQLRSKMRYWLRDHKDRVAGGYRLMHTKYPSRMWAVVPVVTHQ